jgi:PIN domain
MANQNRAADDSSTKIVFLDTQIYVHYQDFEQINFPNFVEAHDVTIVIPPVSIRELNKLKDLNPREKIKKRAGSCLKRLHALFESSSEARLQSGTIVQLEDRDPSINFEELGLQKEIQDDNLIASIISKQAEFPRSAIVLVTSDAGLTLLAKARRLGIATKKLPDALKLPADTNSEEKRIRELESEIRELKLRAPELLLTFDEGHQYKEFLLPQPLEASNEYMQAKLDEIRQRHPKMEVEPQQADKANVAKSVLTLGELAALCGPITGVSLFDRVMPEQIEKYNHDLDTFYEEYATYAQEHLIFQNLKQRTIKLTISLNNRGTMPAEDIDVQLHFPDGFELMNLSDLPKAPSTPKPPDVPSPPLRAFESSFQKVKADWERGPIFPYITPARVNPPRNVSFPQIFRTNSFEVEVHVNRIKHKVSENFDVICATFDSYDVAGSFEIDYRILAANLPEEAYGKLHVVIRKQCETHP